MTTRLLCFVESFWPKVGGMETFMEHFLVGLAGHGYDITIITGRDDPRLPQAEDHRGLAVHRFDLASTAGGGNVEALVGLRRRVTALRRKLRPDIVHVAFPGVAGYFALTSAAADDAPLVLRVHTLWGENTSGRHVVFRRLLRSASWVTAVSRDALSDLRSFAPDVTDRSSLAYSGVDDPGIEPGELRFDPPVVLSAGRLAPEKGFDVLLRACAVLRDEGLDIRVVIAGDGPERARLTDLSRQLRMTDRVEITGWVHPSKIWGLLERATAVAVPSRWDAFPRVAVEGALMARPVVGAAVGGLTESIAHGDTGLLVEPGDADALASALGSVLNDPERARSMGISGRERARDLFTMRSVVGAHDTIYRRLMG